MKLNKIIGKGLPLKGHKFYMLLFTLCFCNGLFQKKQFICNKINVKDSIILILKFIIDYVDIVRKCKDAA